MKDNWRLRNLSLCPSRTQISWNQQVIVIIFYLKKWESKRKSSKRNMKRWSKKMKISFLITFPVKNGRSSKKLKLLKLKKSIIKREASWEKNYFNMSDKLKESFHKTKSWKKLTKKWEMIFLNKEQIGSNRKINSSKK